RTHGAGTPPRHVLGAARDGPRGARPAPALRDRADAGALARARRADIAARHIGRAAFARRDTYERALAAAIDEHAPSAVVLAGFMRILGPAFVERYRGRLLNIHPSLLPRYRGLDTHARVLKAG